jgi:hypothetical protein
MSRYKGAERTEAESRVKLDEKQNGEASKPCQYSFVLKYFGSRVRQWHLVSAWWLDQILGFVGGGAPLASARGPNRARHHTAVEPSLGYCGFFSPDHGQPPGSTPLVERRKRREGDESTQKGLEAFPIACKRATSQGPAQSLCRLSRDASASDKAKLAEFSLLRLLRDSFKQFHTRQREIYEP